MMKGPNDPAEMDSFLRPMIDEFKLLEKGIPNVFDASNGSRFTLHAHIVAVTGDMPGRDHLMNMAGQGSYSYCNSCKIRGVYNGYVYCPLTPPLDNRLPEMSSENPWKQYSVADLFTCEDWLDGRPLVQRTHEGIKYTAERIEMAGKQDAKRLKKISSINKKSIFFELSSIIFPRSFPIDPMHLFFLNIAKHMRDHWRGFYFPWEQSSGKKSKTNADKFRPSEESYCIDPKVWKKMDEDLEKIIIPTSFGDKIRGIFTFRKANEWKTWVKVSRALNSFRWRHAWRHAWQTLTFVDRFANTIVRASTNGVLQPLATVCRSRHTGW